MSNRTSKSTPNSDNDPVFQEWQSFKSNVVSASEVAKSPLRSAKLLDYFDRGFRKVDLFFMNILGDKLHPFIQAGAIANFTFIIAVITGFVLLMWYSPSVHLAHNSVLSMDAKPFTAGLIRSLHRYSSDACMLFVLFHAFKVFFAGRFTESRWLAWVTGWVSMFLLWLIGWFGYWLVWDERGELIALASAKFVDALPFFAEPLSASFLTNDSFNSVLFLIVFFLHMLIPIGFGIAIWLHISRLNKPGFLPNRTMSVYVTLSLVVMSLILPADTLKSANLMDIPEKLSIDYFYLAPLLFVDRFSSGFLWLMFLITSVSLLSIPWVMTKKRKTGLPEIIESKCTGCEQCFHDCPYNAISLLPRLEKSPKGDTVALIDPNVCVGCGICVGSCSYMAVDYPNLSPWEVRTKILGWLEKDKNNFENQHFAFVCGNSAGSSLTIDHESGFCKEMPGYYVCAVPCAGWVHPSLLEMVLRKGAAGVLVAGCRLDPDFRLGSDWIADRLEGERHPQLKKDKVDVDKIFYLKIDKPEISKFLETAKQFRKQTSPSIEAHLELVKRVFAGAFLVALLGALVYLPSSFPTPQQSEDATLSVFFKMLGKPIAQSARNDEDLLPHMRSQQSDRVDKRSDVVLKIQMGDRILLQQTFSPSGIFSRGKTNGLVHVPLPVEQQHIVASLGYVIDGEIEWKYVGETEIQANSNKRLVLKFNEEHQFQWYGQE